MSHLMVGDSITHHGLHPFYLDVFHLTRFPKKAPCIINRGVSGDTLDGALKRFPWDIAPLRVETASVMFGMNDLERSLYEPNQSGPEVMRQRTIILDQFEKNLRDFVVLLQNVADEIFLLTPTIFDGTGTQTVPNCPAYNDALFHGAERVKRIGVSLGLQVIDLYGPLLDINRQGQAIRPDFTVVGPDRIHPESMGHLIITYLFLKARNLSSDVARITVSATDISPQECVNCTVSDFQRGKDFITFTYQAEALPFPVEESAKGALAWVPFTKEFNQEILQVTGLTPNSSYFLEIDGQEICTCLAEEWKSGVNLALQSSAPGTIQAHHVLQLSRIRWELIWKLRELVMVECQASSEGWSQRPSLEQVLPLLDARSKSAVGKDWESFFHKTGEEYPINKPLESEWLRRSEEMLSDIQKAARPKPCRITLRKIS